MKYRVYHVRLGGNFGEKSYDVLAESIQSAETQAVITFNDENTGEGIRYMSTSVAGRTGREA